jgi:hypothetical protein
MNDLDRAIVAARRSKAALPDLCRELIKGELWFLVPFHPEVEGECIEIKNGSPLPFAMLQDEKGAVVPLFSSETRLDEGLRNGKMPSNKYSAAAMPAIQALDILGKADLRAVVNKSCATGDIIIPANLMRDLSDGSALAPSPSLQQEHGTGNIVNPADYPTHLVQPAFELMRRHRNFRAAWIISLPHTKPGAPPDARWQMLILMEPPDQQMFHDLNLAVSSARVSPDEIALGLLDETDSKLIQNIFRRAAPFYVASDYVPPAGARPQIQ